MVLEIHYLASRVSNQIVLVNICYKFWLVNVFSILIYLKGFKGFIMQSYIVNFKFYSGLSNTSFIILNAKINSKKLI